MIRSRVVEPAKKVLTYAQGTSDAIGAGLHHETPILMISDVTHVDFLIVRIFGHPLVAFTSGSIGRAGWLDPKLS